MKTSGPPLRLELDHEVAGEPHAMERDPNPAAHLDEEDGET